jgi:ketosteroid isomerase-like protein
MSESAIVAAQAFVRAINRQDQEALAALMTPEHRFTDSLGNVVHGRDKMFAGWAAYFRMVPDYSLAIDELYTQGPIVVMLGVAEGTYSADGTIKAENRWRTPVALRAMIEDGLIAECQVYADNEPIREKIRLAGK